MVVITLFLVGMLLPSVYADDAEKRLINNLLANYDKRLRPTANASKPLNVTFGLALAQLIDVDEKNQIVTTNCWLNQAWLDHELVWDPKDYNGITTLLIPYDSIWLPDILLYNSADVASSKTSAVSTNVIVSHTGNVTWLSTVIYKSSCTIKVRFFPFDEQNCSMIFASWTYDGSQLNLELVDKTGDISNYMPSSEFHLIGMYVDKHIVYYSCCVHPYPDITYYIHIKRRPMFYVFNMLLPCCLITLVALLGFYIPSDSGEKVTMGITTLLSMTVFLMLVTEAMPPTSDHLPLIGIYYFITIGIVSLATAMTVCTLNIHHKGTRGKVVPPWIQFVCFKILARLLCLNIEYPDPAVLNGEEVHYNTSDSHVKRSNRSRARNGISVHHIDVEERRLVDKETFSLQELTSPPSYSNVQKNGIINTKRTPGKAARTGGTSPLDDPWKPQEPLNSLEKLDGHFQKVLQTISDSILKNETRLVEQDRRDAIKLQWQQVAVVVDRLLLFIFVSLTLGITVGLTLKGW